MTMVRLAQTKDIDTLTRMRFDFSREYDDSISNDAYDEFAGRCSAFLQKAIADDSNWKVWVAEVDGRVVANMFVQIVEKVPRPGVDASSPFGYVTNVYTHPDYRGQGIGSQIHGEIARWAAENRLDFLIVWPSDNSVEFYARNGFARCKEAMEWFWYEQ